MNVSEVIKELRNGAADESAACRALIDKAAGALLDLAAELEEVKKERDAREPVRRGVWVNGRGAPVGWDEIWPDSPARECTCSACGEWLTASDEYPVTGLFCPNCGAKMKEDAEDVDAER